MPGDLMIHHEGIWRAMWRQRDLAVGTSIEAIVARGYIARGVQWALRGHEIAAAKIMMRRALAQAGVIR